jgi:hypothetical protein
LIYNKSIEQPGKKRRSEMKKLTGTEKQVKWAEGIREEKLTEIANFLEQNKSKIAPGTEEIINGFVEKLKEVEPSKFWIEERYSGAEHLLKLAATGKINDPFYSHRATKK